MQRNSVLLFLVVCLGLTLIIVQSIVTAQDSTTLEVSEPNWDSPRTRELTKRACFDCHSNEVNWPWYTDLPIVGDIVKEDVEKGREDLNFSEWGLWEQEEAGEAAETITDGTMPPEKYVFWHPEADLSEAEKFELIEGLKKTLGTTEGNGEEDESEDEEESEDEGEAEGEKDNVGKAEDEEDNVGEQEDKDDDASESEDEEDDVGESEDEENKVGEPEDKDNDVSESEDKDEEEGESEDEENNVGKAEDKDDDTSESEDKDEEENESEDEDDD